MRISILYPFLIIINCQYNYNFHFEDIMSYWRHYNCPENHTLIWGLIPHPCVSYLPECLGVTKVEIKFVNNQQILCHPNYQINLTNAAIIKYGFYVDPTKSITIQEFNSSMLKFTTDIQIPDCAVVYVFQVDGQPQPRCVYYNGVKVDDGRNMSGPYGQVNPFNISYCVNTRCNGCHPPDFIHCISCYQDFYITPLVRDCSLRCSIENAVCNEYSQPVDCIKGYYKVKKGNSFDCVYCGGLSETCNEQGPLTCYQFSQSGTQQFIFEKKCVRSPYQCLIYDQFKQSCLSCKLRTYFNTTLNSCQYCHQSCFSCNSYQKCLIFRDYFYEYNYINETYSTWRTRKPCDTKCKTCFVDNPSACTTCFSNYRVNNLNQCACNYAESFYEIDGNCIHCSEGICATCISFSECLSCKPETFRYLEDTKCLCQDGYYDDQSPDYICKKCHNTCKTCTGGEISNCLSCDSSINRKLIKGQCVCELGLGYNNNNLEDNVCRQCHETCQTCEFQFDSKSCTTCFSSQFRQLTETSECVCIDNYADNQGELLICYTCHFSCGTCIGGLETDCIFCSESSHRALSSNGKCLCTKGYFEGDSQSSNCQSCHYSCLDCLANPENNKFIIQLIQLNYTECPSSRLPDESGSTFSCICRDEHYFDDGKSQECQECHYSCISCSLYGPKFCQSCDVSIRKLQYGVCSCLGRAYDDGISSCQQCYLHCLTCLGPEQTDCLTCSIDIDFRELIGGACGCLEGYFEENGSAICSKCSYRCKTCEITKDQCLSCPGNTFRDLGDDFSCSCQLGFYDNINTVKCLVCHFKCLTCFGLQEYQCSTCKPLANRILKDNQCLCLPHYFEENVEQCSICSQFCYECVDSYDKCTSCENDRNLVGNTCECNTKLNGFLISTYGLEGELKCDDCHYSCLQCNGGNFNQCLSCYQPEFRYFDASTSTCQCNPGYFDSGIQVCQKCEYQCETCINTENQCLSCQQNSLRIFNSLSRLCQCTSGYFDDGSNSICQKCGYSCAQCSLKPNYCLTCLIDSYRQFNEILNTCDCIKGYFDGGQPVCQLCHYSCFECFGLSNAECKNCNSINTSKRILKSASCICQNGYYDNGSSSNCQPCDIVCQNCESQSYLCTSCSTTRILSINFCKCKQGYYDIGQKECLKCDSNCLECTTNSKTCTVCDDTLFRVLDTNTKVCVCQSNYLELSGICVMCNSSCLTCSSTIDTCSSCSEDRILLNNECFCKEGYFNQQGNCLLCHKSCLSCKDSEQFCLTCSVQNYRQLLDNKCPCIVGYYESSSTLSCEKCDASCKTCAQDSNTCTSCDSFLNYDILNNKCVCKEGFYFDQNSNLCSACHISCKTCDQKSKCNSCAIETRIYDQLAFTCECKLGYFEINQQNCQKCHYQCQTCSDDEKNCLSCNSQVHRLFLNNKCECETGYFDAGIDICVPCGTKCKACIELASKCTQCYETEQFRKLNVFSCDCQSGYLELGLDVCQKCSIKCKTCNNFDDYCTSCDIDQKRMDLSIFHKCPCMQGFYEDADSLCQKCHIKCETCVEKRDKCLVCNDPVRNNRYLLSNQCNCKPGFYDDDIQLECLKCNKICKTCTQSSTNCLECANNLRINPPLCACQDGYYEDETQNCMKCQNKCLTCMTSESNCTSCKPGRINQNCECESGYFEAGLEDCQRCSFSCLECYLQSTNCTVCKGDRINSPICNCEDGYYDDGSNEKCQSCDFRCQKCDILGCLSCNGNRILSTEQTCDPPVGSVSYETTPWCSNCEIAILDIRFSDDLSSLIIRFDFELKLLKSLNNCSSFLDDETLDQLGFGFNCQFDEINNRNLIIILGIEPRVLIGGQILIKGNILQHTNCDQKIQKFIFNIIKGPENILIPQISYNVPNQEVSACVQNIIYSNFTFCDGNRQFTQIKWSYKIKGKASTQELDDFIKILNINQEIIIVIPAKTLPESSTIAFFVEVYNFIGTQAISSFEIDTQSDFLPIILVDLKKKYYVYQEIEIPFSIQMMSCHSSILTQTQSLFQIELNEISRNNPLSKSSNINFQVQSSDINYSITIQKYSLSPLTIYDFQLKAFEMNSQSLQYKQFSLEISPAKLLCQFENAVNIQNFRKELIINLICKDLNTDLDWNQDSELNVEIICIDLSTNSICLNQQNKPIEIKQNSYQQIIPRYSVKPFTAQNWQVVVTKGSLRNTYEQIIIFLDDDFIPLEVNHSLAYLSRNINNYEPLNFIIQIPFEKQKKVVEISLGIIEDFSVVSLLQLQYIQYSMILQDYITLNQKHQNNKYNLKFAIQYSTSINPSFYNLPLTLNLPPICPSFKQIENNYEGLTEIEILVNCARAEDSPYEYKLGYFLSDEEMKGYLNRSNEQIYGLQMFQDSPKFKMIIPNSFKNNPIKFIISVMDQGGSITNLFGQTQVQKNFDCKFKQISNNLSLQIAYMFQAIGQEEQQCQDLGKRLYYDLLSKNNLENQELNFWLRAINAYKSYSLSSQTRLLDEIYDSTCLEKEKSKFQIISSNLERNQTKSYEQLWADYKNFNQIVKILASKFTNFSSKIEAQNIDWNQNLYQQYEEAIESLQLSLVLCDLIFIDASSMNKNETKMFTLFEKLLSLINQISQIIQIRAQVNNKPLQVEGKAFIWKLQRITRKILNENLSRKSNLEDDFVSYSQKEQIELFFNPYQFKPNISEPLKFQYNINEFVIDSKKMMRLNLSNFNLQKKQVPQLEIESQFSIDMYKTQSCLDQNDFQAYDEYNALCLQFQGDEQIQTCNLSLKSQQLDDQISVNCICSSFGDTFILYYQNQSQNKSILDILSAEQIQYTNFIFDLQSGFVIGIISYVVVVLIFFFFMLKKKIQQDQRQITQDSEENDKSKQQILFYPGNFTIIKENIKYLHSLSSFCQQNSSSISNSFRFIDLNNLFCSMILIAYIIDFYIHIPIIIEIVIITLVGIIYRSFSKILQGVWRINKYFKITVNTIEVIFFLVICFVISVLMSNSSIQNNIEQLKVIAIAAIIQFFIYEIILVTLSVFIYKLIYQSIRHKELNAIYHFVYFFVYHERLDIIFDLYTII